MLIKLKEHKVFLEQTEGESQVIIYFRGYFLNKQKLYYGKNAEVWLHENIIKEKHIKNIIAEMNGVFSLILVDKLTQTVTVCSDRYGFYPLYYSQPNERELYLGENWRDLVQYSGKALDLQSLYDMSGLGYVQGNRTLLRGIKEFAAHTITQISWQGETITQSLESYWRIEYLQKGYNYTSEDFSIVWKQIIKEFSVNFIEMGLTPYIPISGGLDSRLLSYTFSENQVPFHSMTYSSSREGTDIFNASRVVARLSSCLSYKTFILNEEKLKELLAEKLHADRLTCGLFAEKNLFYLNQIYSQAQIFMPGHAGDYITGGHVNVKMKYWKSIEDGADYVYNHKSSINKVLQDNLPGYKERMYEAVRENLCTDINPTAAYMRWNMENRQRRLIARSAILDGEQLMLLVLPFYDHRFIDFFCRIKMTDLLNMKLYVKAQKNYLYKDNIIRNLPRGNDKLQYFGNEILTEYIKKIKNKFKIKYKPENIWENSIDWAQLPDWDFLPEGLSAIYKKSGMPLTNYQFIYSICKFNRELNQC